MYVRFVTFAKLLAEIPSIRQKIVENVPDYRTKFGAVLVNLLAICQGSFVELTTLFILGELPSLNEKNRMSTRSYLYEM